jgi:predicted O-methyltransferase YrrM
MNSFLLLGNVVLVAVVAVLTRQLLDERSRRKQRTFIAAWPIKPVLPEAIDSVFTPGAFGPDRGTEIRFLGRGPYVVEGGTSDAEAWILAVLARRARRMFEFGTCTGKTAYLWALNAPEDARITTLTLAPDESDIGEAGRDDDATDRSYAARESAFSTFLYSNTPVADKIEQLFGDSKTLDVAPWAGKCDLVFVDGSHAYSYVRSDSEKALTLVRPGGLVLWHDYAGPRHSKGVYRALNELAERVPLVRIQGTSLVAYRRT